MIFVVTPQPYLSTVSALNQDDKQFRARRWIGYSLVVAATASVLTLLTWRAYERHSAIEYFQERGGQVAREPLRPALLNDAVVATIGNNFTNIKTVSMQDTGVSDATVDSLASLTRAEFATVERLNLENTNVTDSSLRHLSVLTKLKRLILENTDVTDSGLSEVSRLASLQALNLEETHVTDAGLPKLQKLSQLRELSLNKTRVSDDGLPYLWVHAGLTSLDLRNTNVTDSGVAELRIRLPNCRVLHSAMNP